MSATDKELRVLIQELMEDTSDKSLVQGTYKDHSGEYTCEFSKIDRLLSIVRKGVSLATDSDIIGATGLLDTQKDGEIERAIRIITGADRIKLSYDNGVMTYEVSVSEGWYMLQDDNYSLVRLALKDINASMATSDNTEIKAMIKNLGMLQDTVRKCKTAHPEFVLNVFPTEDLQEYGIEFNGTDYAINVDLDYAITAVYAIIAGYEAAERKNPMTKSHSERDIYDGCMDLMDTMVGQFENYLDFIGVDTSDRPEDEQFCVSFHNTEIAERLFLWKTTHSGGTSQAMKCRELGIDPFKTVRFAFSEEEDA